MRKLQFESMTREKKTYSFVPRLSDGNEWCLDARKSITGKIHYRLDRRYPHQSYNKDSGYQLTREDVKRLLITG